MDIARTTTGVEVRAPAADVSTSVTLQAGAKENTLGRTAKLGSERTEPPNGG